LRMQKNRIRHMRCSFLQVASCSYHSLASRLENLNDRTIQCYSDIPWYIHEQKANLTHVWAFEVDFLRGRVGRPNRKWLTILFFVARCWNPPNHPARTRTWLPTYPNGPSLAQHSRKWPQHSPT
jgi:hypothetical protein